ncbi:MAG: glycosyltransferase family 39 protein [Longimicrobiales bacterium]
MTAPRAVAVLVLALALRLGVALAWAPPLEADPADYHRLSVGLVEGAGYVDADGRPTAWRPPLYPGMVAGIYAVVGPRPAAVRIVQALMGTATVALVMRMGFLLLGGTGGLLAGALAAVQPGHVFGVSRLLSETLFAFLFVATVLALCELRRAGAHRFGWALAAGALMGMGALARGVFLLFPLAVVPALVLWPGGAGAGGQTRPWQSGVRDAAVMMLAFVVILTPWTLRNARALDAFVPVATQGGTTLWAGNHPPGGTGFGLLVDDATTRAASALPEAEASAYLVDAQLAEWRADPMRLVRMIPVKTAFLWAPIDWEIGPVYGAFDPAYAFVALWALVALVLVVRDAERRRGRLRRTWPLWSTVAYVQGMAWLFYGSPRFRLPLDLLLAVAAAAGLLLTARAVGRGRTWAWAVTSVAVLGALAAASDAVRRLGGRLLGV